MKETSDIQATIARHVVAAILVAVVLMLTGCTVPQWRVFQKTIPAPVAKSDEQVEGERQAADLIAKTIEEPVALKPVAQGLSESLGKPAKPLDHTTVAVSSERAVKRLETGVVELRNAREKQDAFLERYQGMEIENTGVNLFGGSVFLSMAAVVALCIFVPGFGSLVLFMIRRMHAAGKQVVEGIEQFKHAEPDKAAELQEWLSAHMDQAAKAQVKAMRNNLSKQAKENISEIVAQRQTPTLKGQ
jgi:hypothetical protein